MIALQIEDTDRGFCARWNPPANGQRGTVEIHIGEDVYADEWADCPLIAQAWVDRFDLEELEREVAEAEYEPDYDRDPDTGEYFRCG
jgi:hypothetical protein